MAETLATTDRELVRWATAPDHVVAHYYIPYGGDTYGPSAALRPYDLTDACVTTRSGHVLGHIIAARVYQTKFAPIVILRVHATNGAEYYGRTRWDGGGYGRHRGWIGSNGIVLHKCKATTRRTSQVTGTRAAMEAHA